LTAGIGESFLADHISVFETNLPAHIKLAYLPNFGMVRLRLTAIGDDSNMLTQEIHEQFAKLKDLVREWMAADEDIPIQQAIGKLLLQKKGTLVTAESCTGGYIAHMITSVAGSSHYFMGSVVSYANQIKENVLGVHPETLLAYGAVSEQTVSEMAQGALALTGADYAVATSGVMGPGGGSQDKPVGTLWVAVGNKEHMATQQFHLRFDRHRNIELAATQALNMLRKFLTSAH